MSVARVSGLRCGDGDGRPCVRSTKSNAAEPKGCAKDRADLGGVVRLHSRSDSGIQRDDGANDNLEVSIDPTATVLTIKQPDGHCDIFLSGLDANTITWDVYDASDSMQTRAPLARMTVVAVAGKKCADVLRRGQQHGSVDSR